MMVGRDLPMVAGKDLLMVAGKGPPKVKEPVLEL